MLRHLPWFLLLPQHLQFVLPQCKRFATMMLMALTLTRMERSSSASLQVMQHQQASILIMKSVGQAIAPVCNGMLLRLHLLTAAVGVSVMSAVQ